MDLIEEFLGQVIWGEKIDITSFLDTHVISGLLVTEGIGAMDVNVAPGHYKLGGTEYIWAGGNVTILSGNNLLWVSTTGVEQGTVLPVGNILLAVITDNGSAITKIDNSPQNSIYQLMQDYTDQLQQNTGVSKKLSVIDYLSNNIIIDNNSLKRSIELLDLSIGNREYTQNYVVIDGEFLTSSIDSLDQKAFDLNEAIGIVSGIQDNFSIDLESHVNSNSAHGVTGSIVGTQNSQSLTNKTLVAPIITDFHSAMHTHLNNNAGGLLTSSAIQNFDSDVISAVDDSLEASSSIEMSVTAGKLSSQIITAGVNHNSLLNYDANRHLLQSQMSLSSLGTRPHSALTGIHADDHHAEQHTIASHDTTATGLKLNTLTNGSNADSLHVHSTSSIVYFSDEVMDTVSAHLTDTSSIDVSYDNMTNNITLDVKPAGVNHNSLLNYDANRHLLQSQMSLSSLGTRPHSALTGVGEDDHHAKIHTIASHDTSATGLQLNTLVNGSNADLLHTHAASGLSGLDGIIKNTVNTMVTGGVETNISVAYNNTTEKLDFIVSDVFLRNDQNDSTDFNLASKKLSVIDGVAYRDPAVGGVSTVLVKAPTGFSSYIFTLPHKGLNGQVLSTDNDGLTSWVTPFDRTNPGNIGFTTPGDIKVSNCNVLSTLYIYNGSNYVNISSPVLAESYPLVLPGTKGASGDVISTDGTGNLIWLGANNLIHGSVLEQPGDLITKNLSNNITRLPSGVPGRVLKVSADQTLAYSDSFVRIVTAGGKVRIISDRPGVSAVKQDGICIVTNSVGAKISRIEVDINQVSDGDLDANGHYVVQFSSGQNDINGWTHPVVHVIDRSNATADGNPPTEANPFVQYTCSEDSEDSIRARIIGNDKVKIMGIATPVDFGTIVLQF